MRGQNHIKSLWEVGS